MSSRPGTRFSLSGLSVRPATGASSSGQRPGTQYSRPGTQFSRPGTNMTSRSRPLTGASSAAADGFQPSMNTGRRRRKLRTVTLKNEIDAMRREEELTRQTFDLRLLELQTALRKELLQLRPDVSERLMRGHEDLLQKPDFSKPRKWEKAASFAEIFEQNPGYRPTPRDKQSPEWERLFGMRS